MINCFIQSTYRNVISILKYCNCFLICKLSLENFYSLYLFRPDIQKINYEGKMFIVHLLFSEVCVLNDMIYEILCL